MKIKLPKYQYINMDSGWSNACDQYGRWMYRSDLFPNGLKPLSDYLKTNGHRLGIYILPGIRKDAADANMPIKGTNHTLGELVTRKLEGNGFKGTTYMPDEHNELVQAYYDSIADLFAEWGIGFVKIDGCGPGGGDQFHTHQSPDNRACLRMLSKAFQRHDIWMELSWYLDAAYVEDWIEIANGARVFIDIESYSTKTMTSSHRVFQRFSHVERWVEKDLVGRPNGFFLDLDVVLVGMTVNGTCIDGLDNDDIRQSYISFWAMVSSVLCLGGDPRMIPEKYLSMLHHPGMLAIHQSGVVAKPLGTTGLWNNRKQVWWKRLPTGEIYVGLFNTHVYRFMLGLSHEIKFRLKDFDLITAEIKDVWSGNILGVYNDSYSVVLKPGQCKILLLTAK
ncbi:glycoside hydrolase superfamily [Radiomyces spectabilis]|uniref:glycoside hydrolase superfamily n=1 Tax=Radiomyces spectabilis TaxID=64574 RepID=UPI00222041E6|nr:glycoside hydrolase superfamily [Radiomyces spectabilis]KAI8376522.1 glycoside hydrolase superfamily [Radiomyces spectabilis]